MKDPALLDVDDRRLAIIDIGSNSIRLVVFDGTRRTPQTLFNEKVLCGLARHMEATECLDPEGVEMALPNLRRFVRMAREMGVERIAMLATAAVRDAKDGDRFIDAVERETGERIRVLSGKEEAHHAAGGVLAGLPQANGIIGDLGGGSLELVEIRKGVAGRATTLPFGTLRLLEMGGGQIADAERQVEASLKAVKWLSDRPALIFYPVGGTWRNLARLFMSLDGYPLSVIQAYKLETGKLCQMASNIEHRDIASLANLRSISRRRLEVMPQGAMLLRVLMRRTKSEAAVFSAYGLREGFHFNALTKAERAEDPLIVSARNLGQREARFGDLGDALFEWSAPVFMSESESRARIRLAACWLSDIGWREHTDYRAVQAFSRIVQHPFMAVSHKARLFLAYSIFCRYEGDPLDIGQRTLLSLISPRARYRASLLGATLRLAYRISGGAPGLLARTSLCKCKEGFDLELPRDGSLPSGRALNKSLKVLNDLWSVGTAATA